MPTKNRNPALDFYRLFCMFLITTTHIIGYDGLLDALSPGHINFHIVNILYTLQRLSITGFVLISAYHLINTTGTAKKIISFWCQLLFFSLSIWLVSAAFNPDTFSLKLLIKSLFPVFSYHYWYPVSYLILLLFAPILNKIIHRLSQKELLTAVLLLGFFVSVFFHLNPLFDPYVFTGHYSHSLIWFLLLYLIAAYLRLYGLKKPLLWSGCAFAVSGLLLFLLFTADSLVYLKQDAVHPIIKSFFNDVNLLHYNSLLPLVFSVSSFVIVLNLKLPSWTWLSKTAGLIAPTVFGIYLIQEHNAVRKLLWAFVDISRWGDSLALLPIMILIFLLLWLGAVILYLLYRLAHKLFIRKIEGLLVKLAEKIPFLS